MPSAVAAALSRRASAALADKLAEAEAAAEADADAERAAAAVAPRLAPTPGSARFTPVRPLSMFSCEPSLSSSARAAAAGLNSAESIAERLGMLAFIDVAAMFRLATALRPNGDRPIVRLWLARASRFATAEAERFMFAASAALRLALRLAVAEADALAEALAARLSCESPAPASRIGPSSSMSIASGKFLSWAAIAASWLT